MSAVKLLGILPALFCLPFPHPAAASVFFYPLPYLADASVGDLFCLFWEVQSVSQSESQAADYLTGLKDGYQREIATESTNQKQEKEKRAFTIDHVQAS